MKYRLRETPWRNINGEVIALDMQSNTYLGANDAGSLLWDLLAMGATKGELAATLVNEFEIEQEAALADVESFIRELQAAGLLED